MQSEIYPRTGFVPTSLQLHYRANFDLLPNQSDKTWSEIIRTIRSWIKFSLQNEADLLGPWFFVGGASTRLPTPRHTVVTAREDGSGTEDCPQFWSVRYEHPCREWAFRQWRTDIGVSRIDHRFRISASTSYWISPSFVGQEPPPPVPTAPAFVAKLFHNRNWKCMAGSELLRSTPRAIRVGDGVVLRERLEAHDRRCPIVLVNFSSGDQVPRIDVPALAKTLAGAGVVYVAESADVEEEWLELLPRGFRCRSGMVRIYQPEVRFSSERDSGRHRYFTPEQIAELGEGTIRDMIVRSIARRANASYSADVTSIEDIRARTREIRIRSLKQRADDTSKNEWIELLQSENEDLRQKAQQLTAEWESTVDRCEMLENDCHNLSKEVSRLNFTVQELSRQGASARETIGSLEERIASIGGFSRLPGTVKEVAEQVQALHSHAIVFTERGLESTKDRLNSVVPEAWECLWAIVTVLHPLIFQDSNKPIDLEREFKQRTGFELAMSESKHTKRDKRFMELRKDIYCGKQIDISPHIKVGTKEPKLLRVHFSIDREQKCLIIGHCGGHLDNFSSRNQ
ncbi:MAG: hypothetical protein QUT30_08010 [Acidobacteriota bacterium]|nr:hypothetical protein [Acidobacteriota bacterium]